MRKGASTECTVYGFRLRYPRCESEHLRSHRYGKRTVSGTKCVFTIGNGAAHPASDPVENPHSTINYGANWNVLVSGLSVIYDQLDSG